MLLEGRWMFLCACLISKAAEEAGEANRWDPGILQQEKLEPLGQVLGLQCCR